MRLCRLKEWWLLLYGETCLLRNLETTESCLWRKCFTFAKIWRIQTSGACLKRNLPGMEENIVPSLFRYRQISVYTVYFLVKHSGMTFWRGSRSGYEEVSQIKDGRKEGMWRLGARWKYLYWWWEFPKVTRAVLQCILDLSDSGWGPLNSVMNCIVWNLLVHQMSVVVLSQDCPLRTVGSQSLFQNVSINLLKLAGNFTYHQVYLRSCFSYSMEHSPSGEANRFSLSQIPHILWNPKVHYRVYKGPFTFRCPEPEQFTPCPLIPLLEDYLNILPSTTGSSKLSLYPRFPH